MTPYQALFIRAIKSSSPEFRMKRLYERIYLNEYDEKHLISILRKIVDDNNLMTSTEWIDGLNPANAWKYGSDDCNYQTHCVRLMASHIRYTKVSDLKDFPIPCKFRRMK